jgi:antitoxin HigA-1
MTTKRKNYNATDVLERLTGGPLTFGEMISSIRLCDEYSQVEFAKLLGISKSHLCDIEKGRKSVSPRRAIRWAQVLGYPEKQFVRLSLQQMLDEANIEMEVKVA